METRSNSSVTLKASLCTHANVRTVSREANFSLPETYYHRAENIEKFGYWVLITFASRVRGYRFSSDYYQNS